MSPLVSLEEVGKGRRLSRIFQGDNRSLIVGFDHTVSVGTVDGLLTPLPDLARMCIDNGVDGLQMGMNSIRTLPEDLRCAESGIVLRIDRSPVNDDPRQVVAETNVWTTAETAVQAGGDAVVIFYIHDTRDAAVTANNAAAVGSVAANCRRYGIPFMVEVMTKTDAADEEGISEKMVDAARIAFELGADILKIDRTPDRGALAELVAAAPVPVLLRGGAPRDDFKETLANLEECLSSGFAGAVYGRSVWQVADPGRVVRELASVMHGTER